MVSIFLLENLNFSSETKIWSLDLSRLGCTVSPRARPQQFVSRFAEENKFSRDTRSTLV